MRRLSWLALLLFALPAFAQYPEVDAAVEAFMAKDLHHLAEHLPPTLQKEIDELPAAEQKDLEKDFLPSYDLRRDNWVARRSDSPDALVVVTPNEANVERTGFKIVLERRISDGGEALLQFRLIAEQGYQQSFQVWMKFVDSAWRIYELQDPSGRRRIDLSDPKFLARKRHTEPNDNESSAIGSMRSYNTAAITYASTYPDIGYPQSAEDLGQSRYGTDVDAHHAGLLDSKLTTAPFEKNGYRFTFSGTTDHYTVIGRPIRFGKTGTRSFFTDESGVIRSTDRDEEPSASDPPLQ